MRELLEKQELTEQREGEVLRESFRLAVSAKARKHNFWQSIKDKIALLGSDAPAGGRARNISKTKSRKSCGLCLKDLKNASRQGKNYTIYFRAS